MTEWTFDGEVALVRLREGGRRVDVATVPAKVTVTNRGDEMRFRPHFEAGSWSVPIEKAGEYWFEIRREGVFAMVSERLGWCHGGDVARLMPTPG